MSLRERAILGCIGMTVIVALLWFAVLAPKRQEATDLAAQVTQAEQARSDAVARAASGDTAKAGYQRDYATVARLGKAVPTQPDMPSLVYQLEKAARDAKVDLRALSVQTPTDAAAAPAARTSPGLSPTPFTFTIEGSYFAVRRMLAALGRFARVKRKVVSVSGRLLTLETIKISPGRKLLPQIKADISAKAYVAPMPPAPGGAATAAAPLTTPATSAPAAQVTP